LKDEKLRDIKIQKRYLELGSCRKVSKDLSIKLHIVRRVVKESGIMKQVDSSDKGYLKERGVTFSQLKNTYLELECFRKTAKTLNLGINRTRSILKNLGVLKKSGHALMRQKSGENNPFYGKKHNPETRKKLSESAKKRTGERNPNYKHGKNIRRPRDYKVHIMTKLRNYVFNRDGHTCKYCNEKGGNLHAHHLLPFWVEPKAFEDTANMVTVCTECHFTKAHKGNWHSFDMSIITDELLEKYSLDRERLNDLDVYNKNIDVCDSLDFSNNNKTEDLRLNTQMKS